MPNYLTIDGKGGQFPCFWLDDSGGKPWSDLASYNFNPIPSATYNWQNATSGSYALSETFQVQAGQQVNVAAILATAHFQPFWEFGFALLVQGTAVENVLFALRPDGVGGIGDLGPVVSLAAPGPGVSFLQAEKDATGIVLNGVDYGSTANAACGNKSVYLSSKCNPAAGMYRILFGIFAIEMNPNPMIQTRPAAMVVPFFNVTQG